MDNIIGALILLGLLYVFLAPLFRWARSSSSAADQEPVIAEPPPISYARPGVTPVYDDPASDEESQP